MASQTFYGHKTKIFTEQALCMASILPHHCLQFQLPASEEHESQTQLGRSEQRQPLSWQRTEQE